MNIRQHNTADTKHPLPEVKLTDRLASTKWDAGVKKELAAYRLDDDPSINSVLDVQREMAETAHRFVNRRMNQHPDDTQSKHLSKLTKDYDAALEQHGKRFEMARNTVKQKREVLESEFRSEFKFDSTNAAEIRAVLRSLDPATRAEKINQAVADKNGNVLAAIMDADPLLSDLTQEQKAAYRVKALHAHRPDLLALERQLEKVDKLVFASYTDLLDMYDSMTAKNIRMQFEQQAAKAESFS